MEYFLAKKTYSDARLRVAKVIHPNAEHINDVRELLKIIKSKDVVYFDNIMDLEHADLPEDFNNIISNYALLISKGVKIVFDRTPDADSKDLLKESKELSDKYNIPINDVFTDRLMMIIRVYVNYENAAINIKSLLTKLTQKSAGRIKGSVEDKTLLAKDMIKQNHKDFGGTMRDKELLEMVPVSKTTYYALKKEIESELHTLSASDVDEAIKDMR